MNEYNEHFRSLNRERKKLVLKHIEDNYPIRLLEINQLCHSLDRDLSYMYSTKKTRRLIRELIEEGEIK